MPRLLSGSTLRRGGSGEFLDLKGAMPQLPPTDTTATGFTIVTDSLYRTSYRSSLGFIEFTTATMYSSLPEGTIRILATGSTFLSTSTTTGNLVVGGGIGVGGNMYIQDDIVVNGLTIGRGYEGINNIVIKGVAQPQIDEFNNGQESIVIGYDALVGLTTSYKNIAIGRYALSTGTEISNSIAIGDSALKKIGTHHYWPIASISAASQTNPVIITANNHGINSGTQVVITGVSGMTELNNNSYYVGKLSNNTLALYSDNILSLPIDGTSYTSYSSGGAVNKVLLRNDNIAIGTDAAKNLIDGEQNFFFGDKIAQNLTTGSYNFFIGHEVANNITQGNAIIAIGGDNLIDGVDNQVNIGSVFYYNGSGKLKLISDTRTGIGTLATTTVFVGLITNATQASPVVLTVNSHGLVSGEDILVTGVGGMTQINNQVFWVQALTSDTISLYSDSSLTTPVNGIGYSLYTSGGQVDRFELDGGLVVVGGLAVSDNVIIQDDTESNNLITGAITVAGGVGIAKSLNVGNKLTVTGSGNVTLSPSSANVIIQPTATGTVQIAPATTGTINNMSIGATTPQTGRFTSVNVTGLTASISSTTGALTVAGGAGITGDVYAASGSPGENYLLYTPTVFVTAGVEPTGARVGDIWIDTSVPAYLQYIKDGADKFWIQVGTV